MIRGLVGPGRLSRAEGGIMYCTSDSGCCLLSVVETGFGSHLDGRAIRQNLPARWTFTPPKEYREYRVGRWTWSGVP